MTNRTLALLATAAMTAMFSGCYPLEYYSADAAGREQAVTAPSSGPATAEVSKQAATAPASRPALVEHVRRTGGGGSGPIRIMLLGDSITNGTGRRSGYRARLHADLKAAGHNVDFVGSLQSNPSPGLKDLDHEGHPGFNIDNIANGWRSSAGIDVWLGPKGYDPDIILLMIGTNDVIEDRDFEHVGDRLDDLITRIADARTGLAPDARLIVARIPPRKNKPDDHTTRWYNEQLDAVVARHVAKDEKLTLVDMYAPLEPSDLADGVHPTQSGYDKIAKVWFDAIVAVPGQ
jgi:lysophospholipase L1-like esterase